MEHLEGSTAIITGGGSGLGRSCVRAFTGAGANVIFADIDEGRAAFVARDAKGPGRASAFRLDVTSDEDFGRALDFALEIYGRVDIIMNNVGAVCIGHPQNIPIEEWRRIFDVNVLALVRSNAAFIPHFLAQGRGHIVNTASTSGLYTYAWNRTPYAATKAAVIALSEGLAAYLRPQGVGVTCFCPAIMTNTSIKDTIRVFGDAPPKQSLGFAPISADGAADLVIRGVRDNRFLVQTHPDEVQPILIERARDPDGFVAAAAKRLSPTIKFNQ
jgi:NAD(P)-dependent dehydrogenase (short-subunit alcohol dehydrogenase family)